LGALNKVTLKNSQTGYESFDDAALYPLPGGDVLVQSVDFFTPIVDDPFIFGQIAAVNALSDIYAMGADPLFALNIAGFPKDELPLSVLTEILNGGSSITEKIGIPILGGHTIKDKELKYGLVVSGIGKKESLVRNNTARPGDLLVLTKPLGTGIITTAIKRDLADNHLIDSVTELMIGLNKSAAEAMTEVGVNACTDVTGFGLLGHLLEMCAGSDVSAVIDFDKCPFLEGVFELAQKGVVPGGTKSNLTHVIPSANFSDKILPFQQLMLSDAQTSGGLLLSVPAARAELLVTRLREKQTLAAAVIGQVYNAAEFRIYIK